MEGRKPRLRRLWVAAIALSLSHVNSPIHRMYADDVIRQPSMARKSNDATAKKQLSEPVVSSPATTQPTNSSNQPGVSGQGANRIVSDSLEWQSRSQRPKNTSANSPASTSSTKSAPTELVTGTSPSAQRPALDSQSARETQSASHPAGTVSSPRAHLVSGPAEGSLNPSVSLNPSMADELILSDDAPTSKVSSLAAPNQRRSTTPSIAARAVSMAEDQSVVQSGSGLVDTAIDGSASRGSAIETDQHKKTVANLISQQLMTEYNHLNRPPHPRSVAPLEGTPGWDAVGSELKHRISACETLLGRKAYLSANEEAMTAVVYLLRILDLRENRFESEPAWVQAQRALDEAVDFTSIQRLASDVELTKRIIQSHETPVLKGKDVSQISPLTAAQYYRAYAAQKLVDASSGHPWCSDLYYSIGKVFQTQADAGTPNAHELRERAITYYRSAQAILPSNSTNGSQLAYVLLQLDRPREAYDQLVEVVKLQNCPAVAYQNLVEASSRLGDREMQTWASERYMAMTQSGNGISQGTTLVELAPTQFAMISPKSIGPSQYSPSAPTAVGAGVQAPANPPATQPVPRTAGFGFGLFR